MNFCICLIDQWHSMCKTIFFFFKGESYYYKTWCLFIRVGFKIHYKREYCVLHVIKIHHIIFQLLLYKHLTRDVIKKLNNFQCNITTDEIWAFSAFVVVSSKKAHCAHPSTVCGWQKSWHSAKSCKSVNSNFEWKFRVNDW